jgi:XTP/dITP diphosphohydrolase
VSSGPRRDRQGRRPRIVLATRSVHKLRELRELLALEHADLVSLDELGVEGDPVEDGETFETNARIKARFAARATGLPALADDSGIEVDALGGAPGVRSARFAGDGASDEANLGLLIERIGQTGWDERTGRYVCVAACAWPDGDAVWVRAICEGRLIQEPRGTGGFGYDPVFVPEGESRTMAELRTEEKHAISHRGKAFRGLREALEQAP